MIKKKIEVVKEKEKPVEKLKKISQGEYEKKVIELAKTGLTAEKVGEVLRKQGIHPKEFNGKISEILKKEKMYVNPDLKNIEEKLEKIKAHYEKNHQDKRAKREKDRILSQSRILKRYHKN